MTPMNRLLAEKFHQSMLPMTEPLHSAFELAREDSEKYIPPYKHAGRMGHLRSGLVRAGLRQYLHGSLPTDWELSGNPDLMGQVKLQNKTDGIDIRVLKGKPPRLSVPHAGSSKSRRAYWLNKPMFNIPLPMQFETHHNLLLLWVESPDGFLLRLVRPTSAGTFFKQVDFDFTMDLAPVRSDFELLEFEGEFPTGDEEDLFSVHLDEEGEVDAH